jgi:colanic acid/amylovoran biosynthesis protein
MRILFDMAVYDMRNKGNVALLQAAVTRIHEFWPDARLEVLTVSPHLLKFYCPLAVPLSPDGRNNWAVHQTQIELMHKILPKIAWRWLFDIREAVWRRNSKTSQSDRSTPGVYQTNGQCFKNYLDMVKGIDLFIATGSQYIADVCCEDALRVLARIEAAICEGIPVVMVGQGIGPMEDLDLLNKSRQVLPSVDYIFVREKLFSTRLLSSVGVKPSQIIVTGDDAVEMTYNSRKKSIGNDIGIGLRVAQYTEVNDSHITMLQSILKKVVDKYGIRLLSIPISQSAHELDERVLNQILPNSQQMLTGFGRFNTPQEIIKQIGGCRLVVAGTFHAIVFALAQGIPAICLSKSEMYQEKFSGLVDLFGPGCQIVRLDDPDIENKLLRAIDFAWTSAEQLKPGLLAAAEAQIKTGHAAYQKIFDLVSTKNNAKQRIAFTTGEYLEPK